MKRLLILFILVASFSCKDTSSYVIQYEDSSLYAKRVEFDRGIDFAWTLFGIKEIAGDHSNNKTILSFADGLVNWYKKDETPWCSLLMNYTESSTGHEYTGSLLARSWLQIGDKIELKDAKYGDICILYRGNINSIYGHVAYLLYYNQETNQVVLYGGNQGNSMSVKAYSADRVLGIRRSCKIEDILDLNYINVN